jgi:Caulimovirus viroplasmin/Zn-finger in Ran binding protein and others
MRVTRRGRGLLSPPLPSFGHPFALFFSFRQFLEGRRVGSPDFIRTWGGEARETARTRVLSLSVLFFFEPRRPSAQTNTLRPRSRMAGVAPHEPHVIVYAVVRGRVRGIFKTREDALAQVQGITGHLHGRFRVPARAMSRSTECEELLNASLCPDELKDLFIKDGVKFPEVVFLSGFRNKRLTARSGPRSYGQRMLESSKSFQGRALPDIPGEQKQQQSKNDASAPRGSNSGPQSRQSDAADAPVKESAPSEPKRKRRRTTPPGSAPGAQAPASDATADDVPSSPPRSSARERARGHRASAGGLDSDVVDLTDGGELLREPSMAWACSSCTFVNDPAAMTCELCMSARCRQDAWACLRCTFQNEIESTNCVMCDSNRPVS